ncbi:MAG: hypothetical protein GF353_27225 [Candidatus Lokiarchaeota archaeon]|nr:hypothetical protein [Candidatus Lokiarchaeota archaeon]
MKSKMNDSQKHIDKTAAEKKSVGFDYQYYFFLWKLLSLKPGESVGLEMKDDVHTELDNNIQIFYQIKHTIKTKSDGAPANLTALDEDLWKTLSNWSKIISDKNDNRITKNQQIDFLKKTSFVLASNKSSVDSNDVINMISDLQNNKIDIEKIREELLDFQKKTENSTIKSHISDILELDNEVLNNFLLKTFFELNENDLIQKCKNEILGDKIPRTKIADVLRDIDSAIRQDNFIKIKNREKIEITFDDFYTKYRRYYDLARNENLQIKEFTGKLPERLEEQTFIKQLLDIQDVLSDDIEALSEYTRFKLKLKNNIDEWALKGELTKNEINYLFQDAINQWKNKFRSTYRKKIDENQINAMGLTILDSMREKKLQIAEQQLETDMSNGVFYELSDIPCIGWRNDWEKYKK